MKENQRETIRYERAGEAKCKLVSAGLSGLPDQQTANISSNHELQWRRWAGVPDSEYMRVGPMFASDARGCGHYQFLSEQWPS